MVQAMFYIYFSATGRADSLLKGAKKGIISALYFLLPKGINMLRTKLAEGVFLNEIAEHKFIRDQISISFIMPSSRASATAYALLPFLMERGYAQCPDMTELSKKLARLYGAELEVESAVTGATRRVTVTVRGIKAPLALNGEDLAKEYADLLFGVAYKPNVKNGSFVDAEVDIEREKLRELIESEINDKRGYCVKQAKRKFFGDDLAGVERLGYLDELDAVDGAALYNAHVAMVNTAEIEIIVVGALDAAQIKARFFENFVQANHAPAKQAAHSAMPYAAQAAAFSEEMDIEQGKLALIFTAGQPVYKGSEYAAMRLACAIFGISPMSRLFVNVREKQSLCYYCAAQYLPFSGALLVDSGVDFANAERTKQAVLKELAALCNAEVSDKELEEVKLYITNALLRAADSTQALEAMALSAIARGDIKTPQQEIEEINAVTKSEIMQAIKRFKLSVSYVLTKEGV